MAKTIFITGASRGFGRIWAEALLQRGDNVVATARNISTLDDLKQKYGNSLLTLQLDVTNRQNAFDAIGKAKAHFGQIDVVINNAGYGVFGAIEETSEKDARSQWETNVFGLLWVTQAAIPVMRQQGHGHILQLSSALGVATIPVLGLYNASKWAVEGLSETLASEVKDFGIHVTIVEPNGFSTDFGGPSAIQSQAIPGYEKVKAAMQGGMQEENIGIPEATSEAILKLIDTPNPPLRLFLGKVALPWIKEVYAQRMATWEEWNDVAVKAHGK